MDVLACVDFSDVTLDVVAAATELARPGDGRVTLLHVAAPEPSFVGYDDHILTSRDHAADMAHEYATLRQFMAEFGLDETSAEARVVAGATCSTILDVADEVDADVIVVGRHRHGRLHDLLLGNTARDIVRRSRRPLLLVPAEPEPGG